MIVGFIALGAPLATAAFTSSILPLVLLVEGIVLIVAAFGRTLGSAVWHIVLGAVALAAAAAVFAQPVIAVVSLPVILATYLILKGITQIAMGANISEGKGWFYTAGIVSILLGIMIVAQPFGGAILLTGIYIGLSMLMLGFLLLMAPKVETDRS